MRKLSQIKTVKGKLVKRKDCRKIDGEYYLIGDRTKKNSGDCYEINGRYFKDDTGYIVFDHFTEQYEIFNSTKHVEGVISINYDDTFKKGHFTLNKLCISVKEKNGNKFYIDNYCKLDNTNYVLDKKDNIYKHKDEISLINVLNYNEVDANYKCSLPYNIDKNYIKECNNLKDEYSKYLPTYKFSKTLAHYLNGLSFGVEFETIAGTIPYDLACINSLVSLRDGSISGLEYVTLPLEGEKGINELINANKLINNYTTFNHSCSLHLHIGNIPRTEEFILALFRILCFLEKDIYKMFPLYKRINAGFKRKNYTAPLPSVDILSKLDNSITNKNIKENFSILFKYLSGGKNYSSYGNNLDKVERHPYDPDNNRKWNVRSRYHWVNLIPLIFGNKETVEFRVHTPIKDPNKTLMFLLMMGKIINYTKTYSKEILENQEYSVPTDLKQLLMFNINKYNYERKLNLYIENYSKNRKDYTRNKFKENDYNYKENDVYFNNLSPLNFIEGRNTKFLDSFNIEEKKSINTLKKSSLYNHSVEQPRVAGLTSELDQFLTTRARTIRHTTTDTGIAGRFYNEIVNPTNSQEESEDENPEESEREPIEEEVEDEFTWQ